MVSISGQKREKCSDSMDCFGTAISVSLPRISFPHLNPSLNFNQLYLHAHSLSLRDYTWARKARLKYARMDGTTDDPEICLTVTAPQLQEMLAKGKLEHEHLEQRFMQGLSVGIAVMLCA